MKKADLSLWRNHAPFILLVGVFILFFSSVIFFDRHFCFRDDSYYYYPYFEYIQNYWNRGEIPLWDPCLNMGTPLVGVPTSTVFYPFKLLFFLPISYGILYKWYIMIHIPLAFCGIYFLVRHWKFSRTAATLAALSYTFSGSIFFQYSNVVFLIGASWIPWSVYAGDLLMRKRTLCSLLGLGGSLAMMVLGGDPMTAYFSGMILISLLFFYWKAGILDPKGSHSDPIGKCRLLGNRLLLLIFAAFLGGSFAAVQILPTMELSKTSDRAGRDVPLSIWEIPQFIKDQKELQNKNVFNSKNEHIPDFTQSTEGKSTVSDTLKKRFQNNSMDSHQSIKKQKTMSELILDGIFCRNFKNATGHYGNIYWYSITPWDLPGLIWPNFTGNTSPYNGKWTNGLPNNFLWICSLYMGLIPLIIAVNVFRLRSGRRRFMKTDHHPVPSSHHSLLSIWASWGVLISILGALGRFGPYWFGRLIYYMFGFDISLHTENYDPVGSVYWFMVVFLPKFASFRYTAKLITPMMLFWAILIALGWDTLRKNKKLLSIIQLFFSLSLIIMIYLLWQGKELFCIASIYQYDFFGVYCPDVAWKNVLFGSMSTLCFTALFYFLFWTRFLKSLLLRLDRSIRPRVLLGILIVFLVSADLYINNGPLVFTAPGEIYKKNSSFARMIHEDFDLMPENRASGEVPRVYRHDFYPLSFFGSARTPNRLAERTLWEMSSLMPNYNYLFNLGIVNALHGTLCDDQFYRFYPSLISMDYLESAADLFAFIGTTYAVLPINKNTMGPEDHLDQKNSQYILLAKYNEDESADHQMIHRIPQGSVLKKTLIPSSRIRIYHDASVLKDDVNEIVNLAKEKKMGDPLPNEYARITQYESSNINFEIRLEEPATLLVVEQYDSNWKAVVWKKGEDPENAVDLPIERTLGFMRKFDLPKGEYHVRMFYNPLSFKLGLQITLCALLFGLFLFITAGRSRKKS